jgi:predicted nuclease of predicted toxin-antitoxin system
MRVLLDESLPRPLGRLLQGHEVRTVAQEGRATFENGDLLRVSATRFDVLSTADQNLEFQQNPSTLPIAVIVLVAESNRLESLERLIPELLQALEKTRPKTLARVGA